MYNWMMQSSFTSGIALTMNMQITSSKIDNVHQNASQDWQVDCVYWEPPKGVLYIGISVTPDKNTFEFKLE